MRSKLNTFFKNINKIGLDKRFSVLFDMSKLLLEYDTVLGGHVILEDDQRISNEGKKLIRSRTKSELDYYFELLRIYYVNYKNSKKQFTENNILLKQDCMKFIKNNDIKVSYSDDNKTGSTGAKKTKRGPSAKSESKKKEYIPKFKDNENESEDEDENEDEKENNTSGKHKSEENGKDSGKDSGKESGKESGKGREKYIDNMHVSDQNKYAIVPYDHTVKYKERIRKFSDVWKKMIRVISLYTHPDKTNKELLHGLFRKVLKKYENGDNYYLIFIIKILGIEGGLNKKYKNFMKRHKKKHEAYIEELNNRISYLWNARMYYIKCPVYNYTKMDELNKEKLVKFCLTNNILEFNTYSKYVI